MIQAFHKFGITGKIAVVLLLSFIAELIAPARLYALSGGPSQPEFEKFQPVSSNDMVDLFTGDLKYNIPLFEIGGYPVNLVYDGNVGPEEEASWVGLGWNINVGSINRMVRGVPDDFKGDVMHQEEYRKPREVYTAFFQKTREKVNSEGIKPLSPRFLSMSEKKDNVEVGGVTMEGTFMHFSQLYGDQAKVLKFSWGIGLEYDNFKGISIAGRFNHSMDKVNQYYVDTLKKLALIKSINPVSSVAEKIATINHYLGESNIFKFGMDYNSSAGTSLHGSTNLNIGLGKLGSLLATPSIELNSTQGLSNLGVLTGFNPSKVSANLDISALMQFRPTPPLSFPPNYKSYSVNLDYEHSKPKALWDKRKYRVYGTYTRTYIADNDINREAFGYMYHDKSAVSNSHDEHIVDFQRENKDFDEISPVLATSQWTPDIFAVTGHGAGGAFQANHNRVYLGRVPNKKMTSVAVSAQGEYGSQFGTELGISLGGNVNTEESSSWAPENYNKFAEKNGKGQLSQNALAAKLVRGYGISTYALEENSGRNYVLHGLSDIGSTWANTTTGLHDAEYVKPVVLRNGSLQIGADSFLKNGSGASKNLSVPWLLKKKRDVQSETMQILTQDEAVLYGYNPSVIHLIESIGSDPATGATFYMPGMSTDHSLLLHTQHRVQNSTYAKGHHIGEIIVNKAGGGRYVYGLPVYSLYQRDYSFNIGLPNSGMGESVDPWTGVITNLAENVFNSSLFNAKHNHRGIEGSMSRRDMPAHVTNLLLTQVLSGDYVDNDGISGPSDGDLGDWVTFRYTKSGNYSWRSPFPVKSAYTSKNVMFDPEDNTGTFSEGQREQYHLGYIESKNAIAIFFTELRADGQSVNGESPRLLKRIEIYNKTEFKKLGQSAVPVKVVHFDYSYDLCPNVRNFNDQYATINADHPLKMFGNTFNSQSYGHKAGSKKGKLTLQKVWFTHGKIQWNTTGSYVFEYDLNNNPNYRERSVDMWGTYMDPEQYRNTALAANDYRQLTTQDYPYTVQNPAQAALNASAYKLKRIHMPTGSSVTIEYEADDYAYVQDERAMRNFKVEAFGTGDDLATASFNANSKSRLHETNKNDSKVQPWLFVKVGNNVTADDLVNKDDLLRISSAVAFTERTAPEKYQDVNAYMEIKEAGIKNIDGQNYLCIRILPYDYKFRKVHPLTKFGWQYLRDQVPYLLRPSKERKREADDGKLIGMLTGFLHDFQKMVTGEASFMLQKGYCKSVDLNRTFVRLKVADGKKIGGGYRVKSVKLDDNWGLVAAPETSKSYVTNYNYTIVENGKTISSGVATMEPSASEENPLVRPISLPSPKVMGRIKREILSKVAEDYLNAIEKNGVKPSNTGFLKSNTLSYDEGPIGEWFYPNPSVGYSRVSVTGELPNVNIKRNAGTKMVADFYTAKDFPVIVKADPIQTENLLFNLKNPSHPYSREKKNENNQVTTRYTISPNLSYRKDMFGAAQGFRIELNDMHGKPKAQYTYALNSDKFTSAQFYRYKETVNAEGVRQLSNLVTVINNDGTHTEKELGVEVEVSIDSEKIKSAKTELAGNFDYDQLPPPAVPVFGFGLSLHYKKRESYKITVTKVVRRQGLLVETEIVDKESRIISKNLAFDADNGSVLLSATQNEFNDWIYSLTKPARWIYSGLDGSWKNIDFYVNLSFDVNGFTQDDAYLLTNGDELVDIQTGEKFWVINHGMVGTVNRVLLVNKLGNKINGGPLQKSFRLFRSGHRDLVAAPAEQVTMMRNPLELSNVYLGQSGTVIGAKAIEYFDRDQLYTNKPKCVFVKCSGFETGNETLEISDDGIPGAVSFCFNDQLGINAIQNGQNINPYYVGIKGIWRPFKEMVYYDKGNLTSLRNQDEEIFGDANTTNIRTSGTLREFIPYWEYSGGSWNKTTSSKWKETENLTFSDNAGNNLESYNPLNIFSAELFGYRKQLAIATAANARYSDILFDGFEDYPAFHQSLFVCVNGQPTIDPNNAYVESEIKNSFRHWPLWKGLLTGKMYVNQEFSHSGWKSILLKPGTTAIKLDENESMVHTYGAWDPVKLSKTDFIPNFDPRPVLGTRTMLISYWYKAGNKVDLNIPGTTLIPTLENGKKVDQWIKAEYEVSISNGSLPLVFEFTNPHNSENAYFDDFRMLPKDAKMSCYVYDNDNYRLMATLDDNHYATFYEYDEDGSLVRTKVETERGIMTVNQNRSNIKK